MLPLHHTPTRTAAVINEMLRGFPGFHSRLLELAISPLESRQRDLNPQPSHYK